MYLFFFVLNALFPTQSDDFGAPLGSIDSMVRSYMHWNGRIGELLKVWFGSYLAHTPYFAFINALFGVGFFYLLFALLWLILGAACLGGGGYLLASEIGYPSPHIPSLVMGAGLFTLGVAPAVMGLVYIVEGLSGLGKGRRKPDK